MYICICNQVTERLIHQEIGRGSTTVRQLRENLGVTTQCGKCGNCVKACIKEYQQFTQETDILISSTCNA